VDKCSLLLSSLMLQLSVQSLDLLFLLRNQLVALIHLQLSFELLLLELEVILLDFPENLLSLLLPFEIKLFEIIDFSQFVLVLQFIIFDLFVKYLKINTTLGNLFIMLAVILLVSHV
jgi:hypothetical protein